MDKTIKFIKCGCKVVTYTEEIPEGTNHYTITTPCDKHRPSQEPDPTTGLTVEQKQIYDLLNKMIDDLGDAGVDVSYFPDRADNILIKYAQDIDNMIQEATIANDPNY